MRNRHFGIVFALGALLALACGGDGDGAQSADAGASDGRTTSDGGPTTDASGATSQADASSPSTPCWPYDRPDIATLQASSKKVFAHYFAPYPISFDNKPAASDYYTVNYLNPAGESGIYAA